MLALLGIDQPDAMTGTSCSIEGEVRPTPRGSAFEVDARDGGARSGVISTAHGEIATPAFIPLATKASVRGVSSAEVEALGFDLILGNTFHLHLSPGEERIAAHGGLHGFMGWERPIITDSGGFQVFSLAHGGVADEIKGRRGPGEGRAKVKISEQGVKFQSLLDGSDRFLSPETSMGIQAKLGSDIALVFDECTPFHADREYTARSMERTHRWLERCLEWHGENGPERQAVFGIVQGGVHPELRRESAEAIARRGRRRDLDRRHARPGQGRDALGAGGDDAPPAAGRRGPPARHRRGRRPADGHRPRDRRLRLRRPDPPRPPRGGARPRARTRASASTWRRAATRTPTSRVVEGCPCEACRRHSRAYLHYLARAKELTGSRLLTLHNLTYMRALTEGAREAIAAGRYEDYAKTVLGGAAPWAAGP